MIFHLNKTKFSSKIQKIYIKTNHYDNTMNWRAVVRECYSIKNTRIHVEHTQGITVLHSSDKRQRCLSPTGWQGCVERRMDEAGRSRFWWLCVRFPNLPPCIMRYITVPACGAPQHLLTRLYFLTPPDAHINCQINTCASLKIQRKWMTQSRTKLQRDDVRNRECHFV